ncbi:hypothetical protein QTG54_010905 [Skeletonema marinoi]|uniref:Uncharacterized protein n=1 Tax=Skeletonema marinoi TaxID=267567 RepID=A0AAD9D8L0_9STRA|nr:hypothetical protein QTG54_010905 [Skeletonema marinoi]
MSPLARGLCRGLKLSQNIATRQPILRQTVVRNMSEGSRLHSTDIAFKPAESGWGGGGKYANNFDTIFSSKKKQDKNDKEGAAKKNNDHQSDQ